MVKKTQTKNKDKKIKIKKINKDKKIKIKKIKKDKIKKDIVRKEESISIDKKWYWRQGKRVLLGENEYYDDVSDIM